MLDEAPMGVRRRACGRASTRVVVGGGRVCDVAGVDGVAEAVVVGRVRARCVGGVGRGGWVARAESVFMSENE